MENEPLHSGDQPTPLTQPPKELPDDLLRHIFHHLPTDPRALAFVSMAHKEWRRLVHDEENFLRYFRTSHHNGPTLLGLISDAYHGDLHFKPTPTTACALNLVPPTLAHEGGFRAYGCTHGRVLLYSTWEKNHHGELMVTDPLTGEQNRNVFAYSEYDSERRWGPPLVHIFARVYSSKTGSWDGRLAATIDAEGHFGCKPSAVAGNATAVYWMTEGDTKVIEFHLETQRLLLIDTPKVTRGQDFFLAPARDARLRLAGVMDNSIVMFLWEEGAWVSHTIIWLEDFLPIHAYAQHQNDDDELLHVVEYSDDEGEEELLDATMKPPVIGFSEQLDCVFLQEAQGVFMISLESGQPGAELRWGPTGPWPAQDFYTFASMLRLPAHLQFTDNKPSHILLYPKPERLQGLALASSREHVAAPNE